MNNRIGDITYLSELTPPPLFCNRSRIYQKGVARVVIPMVLYQAYFKKWWGVKFAQITYVALYAAISYALI